MTQTSPRPSASAASSSSGAREPVWTERGTPAYRRMLIALFLAGFATFSLLYCVQPLLPAFSAYFKVSPAQSSLPLSLSTGALAIAILCAGALAESASRRIVMGVSMVAAALLNIAAALLPGWHGLLLARTLEGFVLGGVPAVAMAYLAEEIQPRALGLAMGVYVGGTAFGGMIGRVGMSMLEEITDWRGAMIAVGVIDLLAAVGFLMLLPASRNFVRRRGFEPRYHLDAWLAQLRQPGLNALFLIGMTVMGSFVTLYNYTGFRLTLPPWSLNQTRIGLIFVVYLFGIVASSMAGALADRLGRAPVLLSGMLTLFVGVALTLAHALPVIIGGIVLLTIGFFISHAVASGWVGRLAPRAKGHASSLYLLAYYFGSSVMGSAGGWFWAHAGWPGVVGFTLCLLCVALACGLRLARLARA